MYMVFIFKRSFSFYIVTAKDNETAWQKLAEAQSASIKNVRKWNTLVETMGEYCNPIKLKN